MPKEVFSIMTYNIEGGRNTNKVIEIVKTKDVDILVVQETGPYKNINELRKAMRELGMRNSGVAQAPEYDLHVATLSRYPIEEAGRLPGFRNAGLVTTIDVPDVGLVAVCNTHLTPFLETDRLREIETALAYLGRTKTSLRIIAGDLNSLSPQDNYPPDLLALFNADQINKFVAGGRVQNRVIGRLLEEGHVDAAVYFGKNDRSTVPTPSNRDHAHDVPLRLDYAFVSEGLAPHLTNYKVIKNDYSKVASDHYPVKVELVFERPEAGGA